MAGLIALLAHADAEVREHAAHVLGKRADRDAVDALLRVADDENSTVAYNPCASYASAPRGDQTTASGTSADYCLLSTGEYYRRIRLFAVETYPQVVLFQSIQTIRRPGF